MAVNRHFKPAELHSLWDASWILILLPLKCVWHPVVRYVRSEMLQWEKSHLTTGQSDPMNRHFQPSEMLVVIVVLCAVNRVATGLIFLNPAGARFGWIWDRRSGRGRGWSRIFLSWRPRLHHITWLCNQQWNTNGKEDVGMIHMPMMK